jgi:hypothetical protein
MSHPIPQDIPIQQRGFSIFVELGYEPTVRFEEGLSRLYEWYEM